MSGASLVANEPGPTLNAVGASPAINPELWPPGSLVDVEAAVHAAQSAYAEQLHVPTLAVAGPAAPPTSAPPASAIVPLAGQSPYRYPPAAPAAAVQSTTAASFLSYQLGPKIGAGGMGTVHKAVHVWLGRTVAIKFISPALLDSPDMIERFRHEALAIGQLAHPNIVQATDAGRFNGMHYLVTEFVEGADLASLVRRHGWLEVPEACEAVRQAALGLAHAHDCGIVHRDVKPGNLLLATTGTIKLLDFGLARLAAGKTTLTNTGQILGTLDYLAPEQAADPRKVDPRVDQYSLGCTLFYLLTGEAPFSGPAYDSPASKLKAHLVDQPRSVHELRDRVPLSVAAVLERMMAKDPAQRYESLADAVQALEPYCREADLAALVGGQQQRRISRRTFSAASELIERAAAVLGWAFSRASARRPAPGFAPAPARRERNFSLTGLALIALVGFGLSRISCVEFQEEGPPGPDGQRTENKVIEYGFGNVTMPPASTPKTH